MKRYEKIEVCKNNRSFYFTGILNEIDENWVEIRTAEPYNEILKFRKEQIMQRKTININEEDTNGKRKKNNKDI